MNLLYHALGVRGGAVGSGTASQTGRSRVLHWHNPSGGTMALRSTRPLTKMSTRNISCGVKAAGAWGWQPCHLHVPIVLKSGSFILQEPSGPVQACNWIALPLPSTRITSSFSWPGHCHEQWLPSHAKWLDSLVHSFLRCPNRCKWPVPSRVRWTRHTTATTCLLHSLDRASWYIYVRMANKMPADSQRRSLISTICHIYTFCLLMMGCWYERNM
jgi:hypothetical protein